MRTPLLAVACLAFPLSAFAQTGDRTITLTLDEAIALAMRNNPGYQQAVNNRRSTALGVRSAYAAWFPTVSSNLGMSWREGKPVFFEGQQVGAPIDVLSSNYGINVNLRYDLATLLQPGRAEAQVEAADAGVTATEKQLHQQVTAQYFSAVQSVRFAELQDSLVQTQQLQYDLARAREQIGSGISLDTRNAEVRLQGQRLAALRARNTASIEKLRLFELVGVTPPGDVTLTTDLPVVEPRFVLDDLLAEARSRNANLASARATERSADIGRRQARSRYIPSLNLSTGLGGATNMATNATGSARTWPFGFDRNPLSVSAGFSLTLWDGFQREQANEQSSIALTNARHDLRRIELQIARDVTSLHSTLSLDYQAVQLQRQIVETARIALGLAQERYNLGSTAYTDLSLALDRYQQEQNNLLSNIYTYHRTFAQLEAVVGRSLR